jgi:hypothetical protein
MICAADSSPPAAFQNDSPNGLFRNLQNPVLPGWWWEIQLIPAIPAGQ